MTPEPVTVEGPALSVTAPIVRPDVHRWIDRFIAWMAACAEFDDYRRRHPDQDPSNASFREKMDAAGSASRALGEADRAINEDQLTIDERRAMNQVRGGFALSSLAALAPVMERDP